MKMDLTQLPYNATLMSCIKGAADFYNIPYQDSMLYGMTGHAFVINLTKDLCPSGPYVWDMAIFQNLCQNIGLQAKLNQVVFLDKNSKKEFIQKCEEKIKERMDEGVVCMLVSLEFQLFKEYTETAFLFTKPWGKVSSEAEKIEYGKWYHEPNGFTFITKSNDVVSIKNAIKQSLAYAASLAGKTNRDQTSYLGLCAYDYWVECVENGHGSSHGNWWNGMVWSECRAYASQYLIDIIKYGFDETLCRELSHIYKEISQLLNAVKDKELNNEEKISYLKQAKALEKSTAVTLKQLIK